MKLPAFVDRLLHRRPAAVDWPLETVEQLDRLDEQAVTLLADLADFLTYGRMKFEFGNIGFFEITVYNRQERIFDPRIARCRFPLDATDERMEKVKAKLTAEAEAWQETKLRPSHGWLRCAPTFALVVRTADVGLELWPRPQQDEGYRWRLILDRKDLEAIARVEVVDHPRLRVQANLSQNQRTNLADLHAESFDRISDDFVLLRQRFPKVLEYRERECTILGR